MKRLLIIAALLSPFAGNGQEKLSLSFKEAVKISLDNNVTIRQSQNTLGGFEADKRAAYASLAPDLTGFLQGWRSDGNFFLQQTGEVVNAVTDNVYGQLDADIVIFNGLNSQNNIKQTNHIVNAQTARIERNEQDVISLVASQYLLVLQDEEQIRINEENVRNQQKVYDQIEGMFEAGSRAITDLYNQEVDLRNAELEVIRAKNRFRNDMAVLAQYMMIDPTTVFDLEQPGWDLNDIRLSDYDPNTLYETALSQRSDITQVKETEQAWRRGVQRSKAAYYPRLSGFFSMGSRFSDATVDRTFEEQFTLDNRFVQFGARLSVPIFAGLRNRAQVANTRVNYENAKLDVENQEIMVKTDVLRAYQNFEAIVAAYEVAQKRLQAAEKVYEMQLESYNLGIANQIDVARSNRDYVESQTALSQAKYAVLFQKILMDYAIGTLTYENIPGE